ASSGYGGIGGSAGRCRARQFAARSVHPYRQLGSGGGPVDGAAVQPEPRAAAEVLDIVAPGQLSRDEPDGDGGERTTGPARAVWPNAGGIPSRPRAGHAELPCLLG